LTAHHPKEFIPDVAAKLASRGVFHGGLMLESLPVTVRQAELLVGLRARRPPPAAGHPGERETLPKGGLQST